MSEVNQQTASSSNPESKGLVALFVTCLIDVIRPGLAFDVVALLNDAGYSVTVPGEQTCCGQPNYNGGDEAGAKEVARRTIDVLLRYEFVVAASGSCAGMIKHHYPRLMEGDSLYHAKALTLAERVYELSGFLVDVANYTPSSVAIGDVTYHDACAGLREMGIKAQPRTLLARAGVNIKEMQQPEVCCGFGGTFCVKYADVSNNMVAKKTADATSTGANHLVSGDLGCMLNMEGKLNRDGSAMKVWHFAELLATGLRE